MDLFAEVAAGYATCRPAVHPLVVERIRCRLPRAWYQRALDVGCGAGLSTRPLAALARHVVGLEPSQAMLRFARTTAPGASFLAGAAERLPFRKASIDLITAAGSLNYADVPVFFAEARRVLAPDGLVIVYDFAPGRVEPWFAEFIKRYPPARDGARPLDPQLLAALAEGFVIEWREEFTVTLTLTLEFYLRYMMTETNVAWAMRQGTPEAEIREWCRRTLAPVFGGAARQVSFSGYAASFSATRP